VRIIHGRPVLFRQQRAGYKGKAFFVTKFRTMNNRTAADGSLLPDAERITPFGRFLRASSLDEFPELFNVLRGEMSIVGPRPLLLKYLGRYSAEQMRRHDVLPGITGWAQVNGRNALTWEEKFRLDVWYVDHWSFWLDIKIIWLTVWKAIKREGISQPGHATMEEFKGNDM
jgi:sugar transferase EpsL